ncbi:MAG: hypothetical protein QF926_06160 [Alphaproteobacteria bacterium]|nr:hypothetical protein [Alphaproteobacteria bacterium]
MSELLTYIVLFSLQAATICFLFAMLFVHASRKWWLRAVTVALGLASIALPIYTVSTTLGYPDPWPPSGQYEVRGWEIDENGDAFYLFVEKTGDPTPRHYKLPFDLETALELQKAREEVGTFEYIRLVVDEPVDDGPPQFDILMKKRFSED